MTEELGPKGFLLFLFFSFIGEAERREEGGRGFQR